MNVEEQLSKTLEWFDKITPDNWATYVTGFGAVFLTALFTALTTAYFTAKDHRKRRKSEAISVALKATLIHNAFDYLYRHIKSCEDIAKGRQLTGQFEPWSYIQLLAGQLEPVRIEPHELLVFIEAREYRLVEDLMTLGMRHKSICDAYNDFAARKFELRSRDAEGTVVRGQIVSYTKEPDLPTKVIRMELSTLANSMVEHLPTYRKEAAELCNKLTPVLRKHFKDKSIPFFRVDT